MLLKLYLLGAALALMPLSTAPSGPQQETLFPYIDKDITNTTFPKDLKVTTNSDVVLVKCPNLGYHHKINDDSFTPNSEVYTSGSTYSSGDNSFAWVPLLKNKTESTHLKCGTLFFTPPGGTLDKKGWIFNVIWQNATDNESIMTQDLVINKVPGKHRKCVDLQSDKLVIFGKKKEGGFLYVSNPDSVEHLYVNQMFYYFEKPNRNGETKKPCGIIKIYGDDPIIKLKPYESTSVAPISNGFHRINLIETGQQTINVVLDMKTNLEYYGGEEIILTKIRYVNGESEVIENSNTSITTNFTINGYEMLELTYNSPFGEGHTKISKRYYFAPSSNDLTINEKTVEYFTNETSRKPNCPLFYLNIGYLYKFKHNVTEKDYSNLTPIGTIKEISSKTESHIFFKGIEDPHLTIKCFYKTPDGNITTITEFIDKDKTVGPDINEKQVAKDKIALISSLTTTISPNTVKKQMESVEDNGTKSTKTVLGASLLFLLLLLQW